MVQQQKYLWILRRSNTTHEFLLLAKSVHRFEINAIIMKYKLLFGNTVEVPASANHSMASKLQVS